MLRVLSSLFSRRPPAAYGPGAARIAEPPPEAASFPPMRPLLPPAPDNDDPMAGLSFAVERELRSAGYLY